VENNYNNLASSNSDLDNLLKRDDLKEMVKKDFANGDYESSITKAFTYLERSIIYSGQKPGGNPDINFIADDKTNEELRAVKFKLKGAMNWFREPGANGYSPVGRAEAAAQILAYIDLQLTMMEKLNN
jgi:hypothetical protein